MTIRVSLGSRSYPIVVARSFGELPRRLAALELPRSGWVISHAGLLRRFGRELLGRLRRAGWQLEILTIPEAETSKSLAVAQRLIGRLARRATLRVPVLLAFGGGVVGDVTGFVAAVWRRGVPYVQIPTSLLAQVDSAIGGKVGVDVPQAKNLLGAFHQPSAVFSNVALLRSLPARQRRSGFAEVVKYGVIADPALFRFLEAKRADCVALRGPAAVRMVERCSRIKARVVARDERETRGIRAQLNFGHTLGHALEAASGYRGWTHGEAIAVGMCAATDLAVGLGLCPRGVLRRLAGLLEAAGLPTRASGVSRDAVRRAMRHDKKFIHGRPRWVLPRGVGRVVVTEAVPPGAVSRVLARYVDSA